MAATPPGAPGDVLDQDTPDTIRLSVTEATALGEGALRRLGLPEDDVHIIVDQLIDNALCGYPFASLPRILAIAQDAKTQKPRQPVRVVHETPVSALLDGGNNVGYVAVYRATQTAIDKARAHQFAVVGVYNSYYRDCSKDTGFIQPVPDGVKRAFVDGLRLGLRATYPVQGAH